LADTNSGVSEEGRTGERKKVGLEKNYQAADRKLARRKERLLKG
jgi:hypothetical protein